MTLELPEPEATIKEIRKWLYHCPLPVKKQRTTLKYQRNGRIKCYSEEEIFIYTMRKMGKEIKTL